MITFDYWEILTNIYSWNISIWININQIYMIVLLAIKCLFIP